MGVEFPKFDNMMKSKHQHIVLVKHNNIFVGIVTMEDIIVKLVGPIEDENN